METAINQTAIPASVAARDLQYPPIELVNSTTVPTDQAMFYLNRKPQTGRAWACLENGPLRPVRINGRMAWNVAEIKSLLNGGK